MSNDPEQSSTSTNTPNSQPFYTQRSKRQLGLFAAGAGFFAITSLITRRALVRRYNLTVPKFYQPNNGANTEINGAVEALEALSIATINVASVGMMLTGGTLYALDISSLDDIRRNIRRRLGAPGDGTSQDSEKEIEEWFASVIGKKDGNDKSLEGVSSVLERLAEKEKEARKSQDKRDNP